MNFFDSDQTTFNKPSKSKFEPNQSPNQNLIGLRVLCTLLSISVLLLGGILGFTLLSNPIKDSFLKNIIESKYYKSIPTNEQYEIGKLKGMVGALEDPYSTYLSKKEYL